MSNRVFKNYQVNLGLPFQINTGLNFQTIRHIENIGNTAAAVKKPDFNEAETGEEIVNNARTEAEMIIEEAKLEADRIVEAAEELAYENSSRLGEEAKVKGYEDGFNEVKKQYEDLLQEAEFIREHARVEYKDVLASIESDAINIILDIAKKVIGDEINTNSENVLNLIKQAFEKCANKENVILKVSADDYEFVCDNKEKLLSMVEGIGELDIKRDPSLKLGGCVLETPFGSVDASVQTKLRKIEEAFKEVIKR